MNDEAIAITGIGCRYPGGADTPAKFWQLLQQGRHAIGEVPASRFDINAYYSEEEKLAGTIRSRKGGFIDQLDCFDADFFNISPREAAAMDPQQRLLLECAFEALEDSGLLLSQVAGSNTSVYIGSFNHDYETLMFQSLSQLDLYAVIGGGRYSMANRISYAFDLRGESMQIDTACSSALVALNLACQKLRSGESDLALVGGCNVIINPFLNMGLSYSQILSRSGRCNFGGKERDGYARSEGIGMLALRPLSLARRDNNPVYALVRAGGVNNDGKRSGLLVFPSAQMQSDLIAQVWRKAGIERDDVDYVEAHGTGTKAGDPVELQALSTHMQGHTGRAYIGSVKSNIGHCEGGSAIPSLIKIALMLQKKQIVPSLVFGDLCPDMDWPNQPFSINQSTVAWDKARDRTAVINSFGMTGTNAHAVLVSDDDAPAPEAPPARTVLIPLSAKSATALRARVAGLLDFCSADPAGEALPWYDLAYTLALRRNHFTYRLAIAAADLDQLRQGLQAALDTLGSAAPTAAPQDQTPGWVFVFAGHGGQWLGMGRDLFDSEPVFRQMVERVAHCVREVAGWDLLARWFADQTEHSIFADTRYLQPAIFTMQVALTSLLRHYGVQCAAVIGHSLGEIAAAWAAGACELEQACRLVLLRSAIMADAGLEGRMVLVKAPLASWQERIAAAGLDLACINSAEEWVVSGSEAAIAAFGASLQASDTAHFALAGAWPFHSRHCTQAAQRLQAALQDWPDLRFKAGTAAFFSTVSGAQQDPGTLDAAYWADNLRQCVAFAPAVQAARAAGWNHFVEIGSHPVLLHAIKAGVADSVLTAVQRKQAGVASFYHGLAQLYSQGATLDFAAWFDQAGRSLNLPPYPFEKKRYWISAGNGALKPAHASPAATPTATPAATPAAVTAPGPAAEADSTLALVRRLVEQALHHDGIDDERSFSALGLDSLMAMGLAKDLERTFGKAVVYKDIWLHGTARRLADFIDGRHERRGNPFARSWVTLGGAAGAPVKLLCLHCAGGNPAMFHEWARHLGPQVELLAVQLPGRGDLIEVDTPATLAELVQALLPGLVERLQGCHFHLLGHSLGALLAWELAQALAHNHGLLAQAVWLVGAAAPQAVGSRADFVAMAATNLPGLFPGYSVAMDDAVRQDLIALLLRDLALLDGYRYQHSKPLALPLLHFCAGDDTVLDHAMQQGWRELSAHYRQIQVAGDHISMLHSHALLAQLQAHLGAAPQAI